MIPLFSSRFEKLAEQHFGPVCVAAGLHLSKINRELYEVRRGQFVVRIRLGKGHKSDFLVTISDDIQKSDTSDLKGEIGLAVMGEFHKRPLTKQDFDPRSNECVVEAFSEAAAALVALCFPYLLGLRDSLTPVRAYIEEKIVESGIRDKKFHFPRNVREEWL